MSVYTTQPNIVVYTGNNLQDNSEDKHKKHAAICLETCGFIDAMNNQGKEGWPKNVTIGMNDVYEHVTIHKF